MEITLKNGVVLTFPRASIDEFAGMTPDVMQKLTVSHCGSGLDLDATDVHIDVNGLITSLLTPADMATCLARHGRTTTAERQPARTV